MTRRRSTDGKAKVLRAIAPHSLRHGSQDVWRSRVLPWFLPGVAISVAVALAAGDCVSRALGVRRAVARVLSVSLGITDPAGTAP